MMTFKRKLILLTFVHNVHLSLGISLQITGNHPKAILNLPYTLFCKVTDSSDLVDDINFHKKNHSGAFGPISQNTKRCSVPEMALEGYIPFCGKGTMQSSSVTKVYGLKILKMAGDDFTEWWCTLKNNGILSSYYTIKDKLPEVEESNFLRNMYIGGAVCTSVLIVGLLFCYHYNKNNAKHGRQNLVQQESKV